MERKLQRVRDILGKRKSVYAQPDNKTSPAIKMKHIHKLNELMTSFKTELKNEIENNTNEVRIVRKEKLTRSNVVAVFDSTLTRALDMQTDIVNEQLVIVKVYYFGVAESMVKNGFIMNGQKYRFFSASAGQIRTKKFLAIREEDYEKIYMKLSCGLDIPTINAAGGVNTNKYLAYQALCSSATDVWTDFDIDKSIVVDDFETTVKGLVDFIDEKDYSIVRKEMEVPIPHTDGCGMVLPKLSKKNFMVRAPWIKGLLAVFPFDKFIREERRKGNKKCGLVTDIYGQEHDIIEERIEVIFTKSQVKLWKFYNDWNQYREYFKKYNCEACKCNEEEAFIEDAHFNYQMLQTLTSITDEELGMLASRTNNTLKNISSDRETMLRVFGATKTNCHKTYFQKALLKYPELLQDPHCRETLRDLKNSLEKYGKAGRLEIDGKYLFLIPDLYAACEYWFKGIEKPEGLLKNGEVYCSIYKDRKELDCLRSPHLYREHCVRTNVADERTEAKRWFLTNGIYTSTHDLISKVLQFDVDGDKSLVVADPTLIEVAKRECKNVVPLYYNMAKAPAKEITPDALYEGMITAYTSGNIGAVSNKITKIWNLPEPDLDAIKQLCCLNNFTIDSAKTLYKPLPPDDIAEHLNELTKNKVPHFFIYAKGKRESQVMPAGNGCVDRLEYIINHCKFNFHQKQLGYFDYKVLMDNGELELTEKDNALIKAYYDLSSTINGRIVVDENGGANYDRVFGEFRQALLEIDPDINHLVDVLVKQTFDIKRSKHKTALWQCFGEEIYQNICRNLPENTIMCQCCGKRIVKTSRNQIRCPECAVVENKKRYYKYNHGNRLKNLPHLKK